MPRPPSRRAPVSWPCAYLLQKNVLLSWPDLTLYQSILSNGGNDSDLFAVRYFLIGQHLGAGSGIAYESCHHVADRPGHQQDRRLALHFLTLNHVGQGTL